MLPNMRAPIEAAMLLHNRTSLVSEGPTRTHNFVDCIRLEVRRQLEDNRSPFALSHRLGAAAEMWGARLRKQQGQFRVTGGERTSYFGAAAGTA